MDVATPTADCLDLVHDLLEPIIMRGRTKETLSHQEVGKKILFCSLVLCSQHFIILAVLLIGITGVQYSKIELLKIINKLFK